jgi:hypothetical protein
VSSSSRNSGTYLLRAPVAVLENVRVVARGSGLSMASFIRAAIDRSLNEPVDGRHAKRGDR